MKSRLAFDELAAATATSTRAFRAGTPFALTYRVHDLVRDRARAARSTPRGDVGAALAG